MSFRKYGGTNYAASHNYVKSNVNISNDLYVTDGIGQPESFINCFSDLSGNFLNQGITGPTGPSGGGNSGIGATGPQGFQGGVGSQGFTGPQGNNGDQGNQGNQGNNGDAYWSTVGTNTLIPVAPYLTIQANTFNATSDYRIKENIHELDRTFNVNDLRPVTYTNIQLGKQDIGIIAHELQEIYPFLVNGEKDGENFQSVNYSGIIGILIKEIQNLKKEIIKIKQELNNKNK